jgi:hypothetical protein
MTNTYAVQAARLLESMGVEFSPRRVGAKCPQWCDGKQHIHGDRYIIEFTRGGTKLTIEFWNSWIDRNAGKDPEAYDVIACMEKSDPGTFEDWCADLGYDTDPRKSEKTWRACVNQWLKVRAFFTAEEIEQLQEVQ